MSNEIKIQTSEAERFLTVREAAARGRLSVRTIWTLISRGALRVARPAGLRVVRIPESEFERLMEPRAISGSGRVTK